MAAQKGINLCKNNSTLAATSPVTWPGGYANLIIAATTYPTTSCFLQTLASDGVTWVNIAPATVTTAPTTITANGCYAYNLHGGQYRLLLAGTSVAAMYADLVSVPFD